MNKYLRALIAALLVATATLGADLIPIDATTPLEGSVPVLFFGEQSVRFRVRPEAIETGREAVVVLRFNTPHGAAVTPRVLEVDFSSQRNPIADFGQLAPGEYTVSLGESTTLERVRFIVRNGDEDHPTRRQYLRWKILNTRTFADAQRLLLSLATLESKNPWVFEQLGNRSLDIVPLDESVAYFNKAAELVRSNWKAHQAGGQATAEDESRVASYLESLTTIPRLAPYYSRRRGQLRLSPFTAPGGAGKYIWIDRATGKVLGYANPERPDEITPIHVGLPPDEDRKPRF